MKSSLPHIVIVGAGFAGLNVALSLWKTTCQITVIDKSNYHLFQPLLYQVATAGLSPGEIAAPIRHILRGHRNTEVVMAEVVGVDKKNKQVLLKNGKMVAYDYLVIATGSRHSYFNHAEWEAFAPGLKSISDATNIRRRILSAYEMGELEPDPQKRATLLTVAIVGGGPTGVEMAGSIAELAHRGMTKEFMNFSPASARVLLVEAGPRILASFSDSLALKAEQELQRLKVEVKTNARVESMDNSGIIVNGIRYDAHTVIWAAGVRASPAGEWLGIETDRAGRVPVNENLQIENHPEIYVLGDTAIVLSKNQMLPGIAPVAMQEGKYVGRRLNALIRNRLRTRPFHYRDKGMLATVGRAFAIAQIVGLEISGMLAWLVWVFVHIMYLVGFRNRVLVLTEWVWAYATYDRGVRLIVEEE